MSNVDPQHQLLGVEVHLHRLRFEKLMELVNRVLNGIQSAVFSRSLEFKRLFPELLVRVSRVGIE